LDHTPRRGATESNAADDVPANAGLMSLRMQG
jgi:hypothetical protein